MPEPTPPPQPIPESNSSINVELFDDIPIETPDHNQQTLWTNRLTWLAGVYSKLSSAYQFKAHPWLKAITKTVLQQMDATDEQISKQLEQIQIKFPTPPISPYNHQENVAVPIELTKQNKFRQANAVTELFLLSPNTELKNDPDPFIRQLVQNYQQFQTPETPSASPPIQVEIQPTNNLPIPIPESLPHPPTENLTPALPPKTAPPLQPIKSEPASERPSSPQPPETSSPSEELIILFKTFPKTDVYSPWLSLKAQLAWAKSNFTKLPGVFQRYAYPWLVSQIRANPNLNQNEIKQQISELPRPTKTTSDSPEILQRSKYLGIIFDELKPPAADLENIHILFFPHSDLESLKQLNIPGLNRLINYRSQYTDPKSTP